MLFTARLAVRFIGLRRAGLARTTAAFAITGIAIGVGGMILSLALTRGFQAELSAKLLSETPHLTVTRADGSAMEDAAALREQILHLENVTAVKASRSEPVMLVSGEGSLFALLQTADSGRGNTSGVQAGKMLAERLGLELDSQADIVVLGSGGNVRRVRIRLSGIFSAGIYDVDAGTLRASPSEFAAITGRDVFIPMSLDVTLANAEIGDHAEEAVSAIVGKAYIVTSWKSANRQLFEALELERRIAFLLLAVIALISAATVAATVSLMVEERRHDIAVLRILGFPGRRVISIFLFQALILGLAGLVFGIFAGLTACFLVNYLELASVSPHIYQVSGFRARPGIVDVLAVAISALAIAIAAGIYPAVAASRPKPLVTISRQ